MNRFITITLALTGLTSCATHSKNTVSAIAEEPPPKLLSPDVKKIWIPTSIKNGGKEWEEGHYLYQIQRETVWSR